MVGVPGRSKACETCRRRKKGVSLYESNGPKACTSSCAFQCDHQRPSCGQCRRAGLNCQGYPESDAIFVNHTAASGSSRSPAYSASLSRRSSSPRIVLPGTLAKTAFEDHYIGIFWSEFLPNGRRFTEAQSRSCTGAQYQIAEELYSSNETLRTALRALSMAAVGRSRNNATLIDAGVRMYGQALCNLTYMLQHVRLDESDGALMACKLLELFEAICGQTEDDRLMQARGWNNHLKGGLALMLSRTPQMHRTGRGHRFFVDSRMAAVSDYTAVFIRTMLIKRIKVINGVISRKQIAISSPAWKLIPWQVQPKTSKDEMIDILVDLPTMLDRLDVLNSCEDEDRKMVLQADLLALAQTAQQELESWRVRAGGLMEFSSTGVDDFVDMADVGFAQMTVYYWLAWLLISTVLARLPLSEVDPALYSVHPFVDADRYASIIANSMPYFYCKSAGIWAAHVASFPLGLAFKFYATTGQRGSEACQKLRHTLEASSQGSATRYWLSSVERFASPNFGPGQCAPE